MYSSLSPHGVYTQTPATLDLPGLKPARVLCVRNVPERHRPHPRDVSVQQRRWAAYHVLSDGNPWPNGETLDDEQPEGPSDAGNSWRTVFASIKGRGKAERKKLRKTSEPEFEMLSAASGQEATARTAFEQTRDDEVQGPLSLRMARKRSTGSLDEEQDYGALAVARLDVAPDHDDDAASVSSTSSSEPDEDDLPPTRVVIARPDYLALARSLPLLPPPGRERTGPRTLAQWRVVLARGREPLATIEEDAAAAVGDCSGEDFGGGRVGEQRDSAVSGLERVVLPGAWVP